jgi:hypothetical protein
MDPPVRGSSDCFASRIPDHATHQDNGHARGMRDSSPTPADLELALVRRFTVVAEQRHFGHAADALHVSPSSLSRQINTDVRTQYLEPGDVPAALLEHRVDAAAA